MKQFATSYLRFLYASKNEHAVHSPFVFTFVTQCLYNKNKYPKPGLWSVFRKELSGNNQEILVTDFGAGSRVFKSNNRKVADIAKNAGITAKRAFMLYRVSKYFEIKNALEIGTSVGLATCALAESQTSITTIEGCPNTAKIARETFDKFGLKNITSIQETFEQAIPRLLNDKFDLVFFDGNHQKQATINYFEQLLPTIHNDSVWIFDDIHWSEEMEQAWEYIKNHPKVSVTIDTFQWGFVFFRSEQPKEHFIIRT